MMMWSVTLAVLLVAAGAMYTAVRLAYRLRHLEEHLAERNSKLHAFAVELIRAEEDQRARIARELHDGLGQLMTAVNIELQLLDEAAPDSVRGRIQEVRLLAAQVVAEMRRISHELRPAILDDLGLSEAVRALIERMTRHSGLRIECQMSGNVDLIPADAVIACYRLVQEALNNVVRHAQANAVEVRLERAGNRLTVSVIDDGRGIDYDPAAPEAARDGHFGLHGLQERIRAIGGTFRFVRSAAHAGTEIRAELPVP